LLGYLTGKRKNEGNWKVAEGAPNKVEENKTKKKPRETELETKAT